MKLNTDISGAAPIESPLPLLSVMIERRPGELLSVDLAKRSFLVISERGVWGHSARSFAEAALATCDAGGDPKGGAVAFVVVGDDEAYFNEDRRIVHLTAAMVFGPIPLAWLASLLGPGGVPVARK